MMTILYVLDQNRSETFYKELFGIQPVLHVPGMTEFQVHNLSLGLMPEEGIARILGSAVPHPQEGAGIPRCELYIPAQDPKKMLDRLESLGGKRISPAEPRNWGDIVSYGADPDGHILAFYKKIEE